MEDFLAAHEPQLKSINFPPSQYKNLYERLQNLSNEEKIVEDAFEVRKFANTARSMLIAKKPLDVAETFYLIDHVWKNDGGKTAYERLEKTPELSEKMATVFNVPPPVDPVSAFDFSREIDLIASMCDGVTKADAEHELKESDYDTIQALVKLLDKDEEKQETDIEKQVKSTLAMSEKKKARKKTSFEEFKSALQYSGHTSGSENDAYIQKMYDNFLSEAEGHGNTLNYNWSDDGTSITVFVSIPQTTRKQAITSTLTVNSWKLVVNGVQLIKGELHATVKPDESCWSIETPGVLCMTLEKVMAGTLWSEMIKGEVPLSQDTIFSTSFVKANSVFMYLKEICDVMWTYNQTYSLVGENGVKQPAWYIMDQYGCALTHGGVDANFQCSPFFNIHTGATFNLLWPVKQVAGGGMCTRNFVPRISPRENGDMSKARLKAFTGRKVYNNNNNNNNAGKEEQEEEEKKEVKLDVEVIHQKSGGEKKGARKSVSSSIYGGSISEEMCSKLNMGVVSGATADLTLLTLKETSIMLDGDPLPASEVVSNKSFFQSYLRYQFDDLPWYQKSFILPNDLEEFCQEVEKSDVPWMWVVRQVDSRQVHVPIVLSTSYARIVRMCEAGPIAVSRFIRDQPQFRHRRFVLNYSVVLDKSAGTAFIHKEPLVHTSQDDYQPNELICEYDTTNNILTGRHDNLVAQQDVETFKDFKAAMNKLLLPRDENNSWDVYQNTVLERVGMLAKTLLKDVVVQQEQYKTGGKCGVVFGVDVMIDSDLVPMIIDINGECNPPTKESLEDILALINGKVNDNFVQVK